MIVKTMINPDLLLDLNKISRKCQRGSLYFHHFRRRRLKLNTCVPAVPPCGFMHHSNLHPITVTLGFLWKDDIFPFRHHFTVIIITNFTLQKISLESKCYHLKLSQKTTSDRNFLSLWRTADLSRRSAVLCLNSVSLNILVVLFFTLATFRHCERAREGGSSI